MRITVQAGLLLAGLIGAADARSQAPPIEPGGSNYVAYFVSRAYLVGCQCSPPFNHTNPRWLEWARTMFAPGAFRHVIGDYHHAPNAVRRQLGEMATQGQRKIGLLLHLIERASDCHLLTFPEPNVCHTSHPYDGEGGWGYVLPLDSTTGELTPLHYRNFRGLVADIRAAGFNQINVRFVTFGNLDPRGWRDGAERPWDDYHEYLYQRYWHAVRSAVDSVNSWVPAGDSMVVQYDLNAEIANYIRQPDGRVWNAPHSYGHVAEHSRRLWRDYVARYGPTRSVGFTFAARVLYPGATGWEREVITVVNREVFDSVGVRPSGYAFDIYPLSGGAGSGLRCRRPCYREYFAEIARQLEADSLGGQVLVWEAPYNDGTFAGAVREANRRLGLRIPYVMQWPVRANMLGGHFSEMFPRDFNRYLSLSR